MGSNPNTHTAHWHILAFLHTVLCVAAHRKLRQRNEDRQCGPLLAPPCAWGLRAGACKRCGGWFGPNFSAPARVRSSKDGPPAVTGACCLRAASQWRLAIVRIPSKVVSKVLRSSAFGLCRCVVDRLCLRLSSASGRAHRKDGDLRTFYALAAISYRHAAEAAT